MEEWMIVVEEAAGGSVDRWVLRELGKRDLETARKRLLEEAKKYQPAGWKGAPHVCVDGSDENAYLIVPREKKRHGSCVVRLVSPTAR